METRLKSLLLVLALASPAFSQGPRNLLSGSFSQQALGQLLVPARDWHPYPSMSDRQNWNTIPEQVRLNCINKAEHYLGKPWEVLPASVFLDFSRNGNRSRYEDVYFARRQRLTCLVLAELFEDKGRFTDDIANGTWAICEESFWGVPAHLGLQKKGPGLPDVTEPVVDLFAAETGALLAWTSYLTGDKLDQVSPLIRERINLEEERRIITPYLQRSDFWWMGFSGDHIVNNWNPWINSNVLNIVLFLEKDDARRIEAVYKSMQSVDIFINSYPDDGGCDEGPGYWGRAGGSLFDYLNLIYLATDGKINIFDHPLIRNIGQFIYKVWIHNDYYINFADASAIEQPEAGLVYRFGKSIHDREMTGFGAFLLQRQMNGRNHADPDDGSFIREIPDLLIMKEMLGQKPVEPYRADFWLPGLEIMGARSHPDSDQGLYLAAKGGNNGESHNHNDVGNFIVYSDGLPLLVDVGVETYTAKTFSNHRYDIWTMQSQYHNLPTINGIQQAAGGEYKASDLHYKANSRQVSFYLDVAKAYPKEAEVQAWHRKIVLERGKKITLTDDYRLFQSKEPVRENMITAFAVDITEPGHIILKDKKDPSKICSLNYNPSQLKVTEEEIGITDSELSDVWGDMLTRLVFVSKTPAQTGHLKFEIQQQQ